ncbi:MAG: hypothetical protein ACRDRT_15810, partial [Pseudonocardiaceae bacterium]
LRTVRNSSQPRLRARDSPDLPRLPGNRKSLSTRGVRAREPRPGRAVARRPQACTRWPDYEPAGSDRQLPGHDVQGRLGTVSQANL